MLVITRIRLTVWVCILLLSGAAVQAEDAKTSGAADAQSTTINDSVPAAPAETADEKGAASNTGDAVQAIEADTADDTAVTPVNNSADAAMTKEAGTVDDAASTAASESAKISESNAVAAKAASYNWAFTGYVAWMSGDQLGDMLLFNAELSDNKFYVAALTRRLKTFYKDMDWEVEGQIAKHAGNGSGMYYWELNALTSVRWNRFVWDKYVDTSFATGLGLSWASDKPPFEIEEHGSTEQLLAYILVELTFSPPKHTQWAGVVRIHHRSSAYGTFADDIQGASNSLGVGVKYRF